MELELARGWYAMLLDNIKHIKLLSSAKKEENGRFISMELGEKRYTGVKTRCLGTRLCDHARHKCSFQCT